MSLYNHNFSFTIVSLFNFCVSVVYRLCKFFLDQYKFIFVVEVYEKERISTKILFSISVFILAVQTIPNECEWLHPKLYMYKVDVFCDERKLSDSTKFIFVVNVHQPNNDITRLFSRFVCITKFIVLKFRVGILVEKKTF